MKNKKRILIIAEKGLGKSGVPCLIMSLVRSLSYKYIFDIVLFNDDDFYLNDFLSFGGVVYKISLKKPERKIDKLFYYLTYSHNITKKIKHIFKNSCYFAIHSFKEDQSFPILKYAKKVGIKIRITHTNSFQVISSFKNIVYRIILKYFIKNTLKYSTLLVGPSSNVCKSFYHKNTDYKVVVNPIPNEDLSLAPAPKSNSTIVITHIATFSDRKNQIFSVRLISLLRKKGLNVILYLVGKEAECGYKKQIDKEIKTLNLESSVLFFDSEVNQNLIYENTHLSILPSKEEAFGIVAIESQARGICCFASDSIPEETNAGNIKYLPLEEEIWAKEIINYINKGTFRKEVNLIQFSESVFAKKIDDIYCNNNDNTVLAKKQNNISK